MYVCVLRALLDDSPKGQAQPTRHEQEATEGRDRAQHAPLGPQDQGIDGAGEEDASRTDQPAAHGARW